jgi:hypothetical protein
MAAKKSDRLAEVIREIEALAKRLRVDLRRAARETGLTKNLEKAATALRKRAAMVAAQVEKYAREVRVELSKAPKTPKRARKRVVARAA